MPEKKQLEEEMLWGAYSLRVQSIMEGRHRIRGVRQLVM